MDNSALSPSQICFGLDPELDRRSFSCFLQLAGNREFADILASRLDSNEIEQFVDMFTGLLRKHISKSEYHHHFLHDDSHQHDESEG
jgi:hypothetical protein